MINIHYGLLPQIFTQLHIWSLVFPNDAQLIRKCSIKSVFLKISQNFIKENSAQVFS